MIRIVLILFIGFSYVNNSWGQIGKSKFYLAIDDYGQSAKVYLDNLGNKDVQVILQDKICEESPSSGKEAQVNTRVLGNYIKQIFPDKRTSGIGVLDWEGRSFDLLSSVPASNQVYQSVLAEFLTALRIAKSLRPNVSWGFWGIPFKRINFKTDEDWISANLKIAELLQACDILCPDLYSYNPTNLGNLNDVKLSIRLGQKYDKKVYPFIWHRYNGGEQANYRLKLIPQYEFVNYALRVANTKYNNKKADGIIWWAKDIYFYTHKENALLEESANLESFKKHYDNLIINYSKGFLKAVKR